MGMKSRQTSEPPQTFSFGSYEPSPLDRAQELVHEARSAPTLEAVRSIARSALVVCPDCADAHVLLGDSSSKIDDAMVEYQKAVEAGERSLGPRVFADDVGFFWGLHETRPYMRAVAGLANCLRQKGKLDEAITQYQELLRLNPGDNQGVRYLLAPCLAEALRHVELRDLLAEYEEDRAGLLWVAALLEYREGGDCAKSRKSLASAIGANPFVLAYLIGHKAMPSVLPDYVGIGDEDEAVSVAAECGRSWAQTLGAVEWLRSLAAP